ncbi:hypothetical protein F4811DRAFT_510718 [Daldinia bambusicola]|nr:hypothetical protein F4811DRAFT_510718 [Daldinia bambusicola]
MRYFHFVHDLENLPTSEDGGLIEVQVFRCRGRRRIAVELDSYSHAPQEHYGITSSSGGLVNNPQDATFYEYHLEDARDSPFATFCFYYRSVQYLEQRNLIPKYETRARPASISSVNSPSLGLRPSFDAESLDDSVFNDHTKPVRMAISDPPEAPEPEEYSLRSPPLFVAAHQSITNVEDTNQVMRDAFLAKLLQRPLPELPKTSSRQTSKSSLRSNCPSLTPSLKLYAKSEEFEKEEVKLGTAQSMVLQSASINALESRDMNAYKRDDDDSSSDYATSLDSTETSRSPALPSPTGYVPTTGSVLERQLDQFDSPIAQSSPKSKAKLPLSKSQANLLSDISFPDVEELKVTEGEWLKQAPSPLRQKSRLGKHLWSPRPGKRPGHSSMIELPSRQADSVDTKCSSGKGISRDVRASATHDTRYINEAPMGNWI